MNLSEQFTEQCRAEVLAQHADEGLKAKSAEWLERSLAHNYSYHFTSLGRPVIQYPQDIVALQEIIWSVRPDLIIETGIAHGGSLVLSASMLALLDYCEAAETGVHLDPSTSKRTVLGIDIDIRAHNRAAIEAHPLAHKIAMLRGSSIDPEIIREVYKVAEQHSRTLVILDSNHTHDHVLAELEAYAPLVGKGSYCIVFDTVVEDLPDTKFPNRPWKKGNNPKTAVWQYLRRLDEATISATDGDRLQLDIDKTLESRLLITVAPDGYLKRR